MMDIEEIRKEAEEVINKWREDLSKTPESHDRLIVIIDHSRQAVEIEQLRTENESLRKATDASVTPEREYEARMQSILWEIERILSDEGIDGDVACE